MPSNGPRKETSPTPSSEPRAPTHKSSHSSKTRSGSKSTSKRSESKSRSGSKSKTPSGSKNGKNGTEAAGASGHGSGGQNGYEGKYGSGYGSREGDYGPGSGRYEEGTGAKYGDGSAGYGEGSAKHGAGSRGSKHYDEEAPPSRGSVADQRTKAKEGGIDWSLFPYALLGFVAGLLVGVIFVVFFGFCCCIFTDWRSVWEDRMKRAFLGGFATGVLLAIIIWVAVFIALVVDD